MAVRKCPQCLAVVSAASSAAYSDGIECPRCKAQLEVSPASRYIATLAGLVAAGVVWRVAGKPGGMLGWVLPLLYALLAFSIVAPLVLMLTADLRRKAPEKAAESPIAAGQAASEPRHATARHDEPHGGPHS
jgi:hypothetical protein